MKDGKKVLIVSSEFPPQPGGIGNHALNLAKYLQLNHFDVQVISDNRSLDGKIELEFDSDLSFKVYRVKCRRLRFLMFATHQVFNEELGEVPISAFGLTC